MALGCNIDGSANLDDGSMTLLEVTIDGDRHLTLNRAMTAFQVGTELYLPLGELMQSLEFPIVIGDNGHHADGWFLEPERSFTLDLQRCRVSVGNGDDKVDPALVSVKAGDIYVHSSLIERWFPLVLSVNLSQLRLLLDPQEPLPIQRKLERRNRWEHLQQPSSESNNAILEETPYRLWDWPFLNTTLDTRYHRGEAGDSGYSSRYKIIGAGDLLKMNAQFSLAGNNKESLSDAYVTLGRLDPDGDLLGPLQAKEFVIGDIVTSRDSIVADNALGRGFKVSNFPLHRPEDFDRFGLQGELPLGWDVELYKNDQLIAFQSADGQGRYDLTDIPLDFGSNRFRLVFHGPQGQVREKTLHRLVGAGMTLPGKHYYRLSALNERDDVGGFARSDPGKRLVFDYEYGASRSISLGWSGKSLMLDGNRRNYLSAHTNLVLPGAFAQVKYVSDLDAGEAIAGMLSTRLLGFDMTAETSHFSDMDTERARSEPVPGKLSSDSELRLSRYFSSTGLGIQGRLARRRGSDGTVQEADTRLSLNTHYGRATHIYETRLFETALRERRWSRQRFLFNTRWNGVSLRGEAVHELAPDNELSNIGISSNWSATRDTRLRVGVNYLPTDKITSYSASVGWLLPGMTLSANVSATDEGAMTAGLSISSNLVTNPGENRWLTSSNRQTRSGAVSARVFLDEDGDGIRGPNERGVTGATLDIAGGGRTTETDASGQTFISGLPAHRRTEIALDPASLDNPFWKTDGTGRSIVPRPGRTAYIEIPVTPTGSFEGKVFLAGGKGSNPAEGVLVNLIKMDGELVSQTRSAYDGYYNFDLISPGYYRLRTGAPKLSRSHHPRDIVIEVRGGNTMQSVGLITSE